MRQTALTLAVRLVVVFAGLLSSVATARYLGPEGRGLFFFWSTVAAVIVQFGNFGLHASNMYLHARKGIDHAILNANSLVAAAIAGVMFTVLATTVLHFNGYELAFDPQIVLALLFLSVSGLYTLLGTNLLIAMGQLTEFNLLELSNRLFLLVVLVVVLWVYADPRALLVAIGFASMLTTAVVFWRLYKHACPRSPNWQVFQGGLAYGARAYLAACFVAVVARLNAFLLQPSIPAADYGAWSIAAQMIDMMLLVPQSIALVLLPRVMRSYNPHTMVKTSTIFTFLIMIAVIAGFLLVGRPIIVFLYGAEFDSAFDYIVWGMPGLFALSIISILSQYLAAVGIPVALIFLWAVIALLHGLLAPWLISSHGATGAMASQSISYIVALALIYLLVKLRKEKDEEYVP